MSLMRFYYDPFSEFDRLFDEAFNARFRTTSSDVARASTNATERFGRFYPKMDLHESKDSNTVTATFELPGLKTEDVKIDLQQNRLTVSGDVSSDRSQEENGYAVRERHYGTFSRSLQLPFGTKPDDVKAKMENGLLTVTFPKAAPEQQPQRITIQ